MATYDKATEGRPPPGENGRREQAWRVGFVMEQTLGHRSYTDTLALGVERDEEVAADWFRVEFAADRVPYSLPVVRHNWSLRGSLRALQGLRQLAGKPVDALFIHTFTITLFAGAYLDRIPTVLSSDATPENYDQVGSWYGHRVMPGPVEGFKRRLRRRVLRKASAIITWCDWAKQSLIDDYGIDGDRVHVIAPGAEIGGFPFGAERRLNGDGGPVRLLFVGADFHRKGGSVLMKAYRAGLRDVAELHLVTHEDVAPEAGVHVYRDLGPNSPELLELYEKADIFVLPTLGDCFPVVMGEAMAAGLPIVTTNVGALAEAAQPGTNGFVVPAGDDIALVSAINILVQNPKLRLEMGLNGRALAEQRFDSQRNAQRVLDVLKSVCAQREPMTEAEPRVMSA